MPTFDEILPALLRIVAPTTMASKSQRICVVRDLVGKVRLAIEPQAGVAIEGTVGAVETALTKELGGYFVPPILHPHNARLRHFVAELFRHAKPWPLAWPSQYAKDPISPPSVEIDQNKWRAFERALSKQSWLYDRRYQPPWELHPRAPTIVAFYSFKGGVGRTTLLATVAWRLAREGKKVVVIDLDLEAPGVSSLFAVAPERGVLDYIVDHVAVRESHVGPWPAARSLDAVENENITVVPAGRLDRHYLEKLARLDFAGSRTAPEEDDPTLGALKALLKSLSKECRPDYILIDSRAGLHDISGLSLHALSHVDVLVNRAGSQGLAGLALVLQVLREHKHLDEFQCVVVHGMAPMPNHRELREHEQRAFREAVYELFTRHVYSEDEALDIDDATAPHHPWLVSYDPRLERLERLEPALESVVFSSSELKDICNRIRELAGESGEEDEEQPDGGEPSA